jgi:signal transduction histidine kinase
MDAGSPSPAQGGGALSVAPSLADEGAGERVAVPFGPGPGRHARSFSEVFRSRPPTSSESFRGLCQLLERGEDREPITDFLTALNLELDRRQQREGDREIEWARDLCRALLASGAELMVGALGELLREMKVDYDDPLVALIFDEASEARALLALLEEMVESESQLVHGRARAVEALISRAPGEVAADGSGLQAQHALRVLNGLLDELDRGSPQRVEDAGARWADALRLVARCLEESRTSHAGGPPVEVWRTGRPPGTRPDSVEVVGLAVEAVDRLATLPTARETLAIVLQILRSNAPLPSWHPAARGSSGQGRTGEMAALMVDKAVQVALRLAASRWRSAAAAPEPRPARPLLELSPFNEASLEAALLDAGRPPRVRAMAAGLLRVLAHVSPAPARSPRAALYTSLLLAGRGRPGTAEPAGLEALALAADGEDLDIILDALDDRWERLRRPAGDVCSRVAAVQPARFEPRHYTRLLTFLSDDDPHIRATAMKTFQALAGFRTGRVAAVVDGIAARLAATGEDEEGHGPASRDLEVALGITMDRLVADVERLQHEVQSLEGRRRELLASLESQSVRVAEEIHHEVLNTLGGHLATAIDEQDYRGARGGLVELVAELRRIMNNLYPRDLEIEGFVPTIRNRLGDARAQMARRAAGATTELVAPPELTEDTIAGCLADRSHIVLLYRIVLEAIHNARKHSRGTHVAVTLSARAAGAVDIAVADNGTGRGGPFTSGAGMALMHHRAREIGATIEYLATPGGTGTTVVVRLVRPVAADGTPGHPGPEPAPAGSA